MSSLGSFTWSGSAYTFDAGAEYTGTASTSTGAGTVWLAQSNTITASQFSVAGFGGDDAVTTNTSTGLVFLGQSNVINANSIILASNSYRSSATGTLEFARAQSIPP